MSHPLPSVRIPLRLPSAVATFGIGIAGYLGVNLSPYMIAAAQSALGVDVLTASWLITGALLLTAVTGLATAKLSAGPHRLLVARVGLVVAAAGFGAAALVPAPGVVVAGLLLGGIGAGGAVSSSGAALAAFINPDRVAGFSGLANRAVVTVILALVPLLPLVPISVFGTLALFSLAVLFASAWLPSAPVVDHAAAPAADAAASGLVARRPRRAETIAGFVLLVTFALWAVSEDSLWAMAGVMGADQAGLTPGGLGIALSGATAGGIVGAILLMVVGDRLGRAVPLAVLLVAGGALKIVEGFVTDPTVFIVVFIVWNTLYAIAFMYFVATSAGLDADGRWSGPLLAVYLVGSSLTPVIGAALVEALGYQGFVVVLGDRELRPGRSRVHRRPHLEPTAAHRGSSTRRRRGGGRMTRTVYANGRVFTADDPAWAEAIVTDDGRIAFVGSDAEAAAVAGPDAAVVDLGGRVVVPGFIDAHTHLVMMGEALGKVGLTDARTLPEIQDRLRAARAADPDAPRLLGRGWLFDSVPGGAPTAADARRRRRRRARVPRRERLPLGVGQHGRAARARHRPRHPRSHRRAHRTRRRRRARRACSTRPRRSSTCGRCSPRSPPTPTATRPSSGRSPPTSRRASRAWSTWRSTSSASPRSTARRSAAAARCRSGCSRTGSSGTRATTSRTSPRSTAPWSSPASTGRGSRWRASSSCSTA